MNAKSIPAREYRPWRPQPGPQLDAINAHWCEELLFGGARGGGKSDFLLGDFCHEVNEYGADWRGIMFRRSYPQLDELLTQSHRVIGDSFPDARFIGGDAREWRFTSGATLKFRHLGCDADAEKYQGHQYTWIGFDELGNWPSDRSYNLMKACLRSGARPIPNKRIRASANPGGAGHQWIKARFIDQAPRGYQPIIDPDTGGLRMFIPSKLSDNHALMAHDPDYAARLRGVGSAELVRAWLEGDWSVVSGAYFDMFDMSRHVIKPLVLPQEWTRFMAMDWGSAKPFSIGWYAVSDGTLPQFPAGALIRYREWYGAARPNEGLKLTVEQVGYGVRDKTPEPVQYAVADPAIFAQDGGPSIAERLNRSSGIRWRPADNKRLAGWDQMRSRFIGADGKPMLYFFETCTHAIRTIPSLQHDSVKSEDLDSDSEDHAADEVRYACMSRPWISRGKAYSAKISDVIQAKDVVPNPTTRRYYGD